LVIGGVSLQGRQHASALSPAAAGDSRKGTNWRQLTGRAVAFLWLRLAVAFD